MVVVHRALIASIVVLLAACSPTPPDAVPAASLPSAPVPSPAPTARPSPTAPPAIVGAWLGLHDCQRIIDIMTAAGMPEQGLLNVADSGTLVGVTTVDQIDPEHPCDDAVPQAHSHFFTADGRFGSRDMRDEQVDDGRWSLIDADTLSINGTPFDFRLDGDELWLEPESVGTCPDPDAWCPEAWKLMVAMPGMAWTRADG